MPGKELLRRQRDQFIGLTEGQEYFFPLKAFYFPYEVENFIIHEYAKRFYSLSSGN